MDEKTAALRDIFVDLTEAETVTEQQEESPGTIAGEETRRAQAHSTIADLRDRYPFESPFSTDELIDIAIGYFEGRSDDEVAGAMDVEPSQVRQARYHLHLLNEEDHAVEVDLDALRTHLPKDGSVDDLGQVITSPSDAALEQAVQVVTTERAMRQANYRFRDELRDLLGDGDLADQLSESVKADGLEDATEGLETTTSF